MIEEIGSSGEMMGVGCGDRAKIALGWGAGWGTLHGDQATHWSRIVTDPCRNLNEPRFHRD